jgi:predicted nucleotidyltransferase
MGRTRLSTHFASSGLPNGSQLSINVLTGHCGAVTIETMTTLLKRREARRWQRREELRRQVRQKLKQALHELAPGEDVILFGSVTRPHSFHERSDVDIAFIDEPQRHSRYGLQAKLEEMIHHPVDLIILSESRFREKIMREGERWTS